MDIRIADEGTVGTMEGCGPLSDSAELRVKKVKIKDSFADFNGVKFPIDPMIGVIGTAPAGEGVMCGSPGLHGGNMDSKIIKKGARVYFPVNVPGALLQMGDLHAAMGDGELCGTGIEIPGEIIVKTILIKNFKLNMPVTETATHWWVNACAMDYEETLKIASEELCRLLMSITGWDKTDTYMYMSIQNDVQINQACKPCSLFMDLRFGTPKVPGLSAQLEEKFDTAATGQAVDDLASKMVKEVCELAAANTSARKIFRTIDWFSQRHTQKKR